MKEKCSESISLVLPVCNEASVIESVVDICCRGLSGLFDDFEIILVNDGSKDGSERILKTMSRKYPKIRYMDNYVNLNQGLSIQRGMAVASKSFVLHNAADMALALEDLAELMPQAVQCDVLVIERYSSPGYTWWRQITSVVNQGIRKLLFPVLSKGIKDMNFVQIYRRSVLPDILPLATSPAFTTPEMIFRARLKGYRVMTCKADYHRRSVGTGALGRPHDILWTMYDMIRFRFYLWTLKNDKEEMKRIKK